MLKTNLWAWKIIVCIKNYVRKKNLQNKNYKKKFYNKKLQKKNLIFATLKQN